MSVAFFLFIVCPLVYNAWWKFLEIKCCTFFPFVSNWESIEGDMGIIFSLIEENLYLESLSIQGNWTKSSSNCIITWIILLEMVKQHIGIFIYSFLQTYWIAIQYNREINFLKCLNKYSFEICWLLLGDANLIIRWFCFWKKTRK